MSYVEKLERELIRSGGARRRGFVRPPRVNAGGTLLVLAGVSSLAVALLVLVLVGHRHPTPAATAPPAPPQARALVSHLAILRRAQTQADRLAPIFDPDHIIHGSIIRGLTRLAVDIPGLKVFLTVSRPGPLNPTLHIGPRYSPALGDQIMPTVVTPQVSRMTLPVPFSVLHSPSAVDLVDGYAVAVVPDGVARVHWVLAVHNRRFGVDGTVMGNVAYGRLARPATRAVSAVWYDGTGRVIPAPGSTHRATTFTTNSLIAKIKRQPAQAPAWQRATYPVLGHVPSSTPSFSLTKPAPSALPDIIQIQAQQSPGSPNLTAFDVNATVEVRLRGASALWLVPSNSGLCTFTLTEGGCSGRPGVHDVDAVRGVVTRADGVRMQIIVLPRGNTSVTAVTTTGSHRVAVIDGLAILPDAGLMKVEYRTADGRPGAIP